MPQLAMQHLRNPADELFASLGDLSEFEIFHNYVLLAIYVRPEKTTSGLYLPETNRDEDKWQGKVGLVAKKGPQAFIDPEGKWFSGVTISEKDWVFIRPSDGWNVTINKVMCRIVSDTSIKGRIPNPDYIW